jgi:hypothetical protein
VSEVGTAVANSGTFTFPDPASIGLGGASSPDGTGTFYLVVSSECAWHVTVTG